MIWEGLFVLFPLSFICIDILFVSFWELVNGLGTLHISDASESTTTTTTYFT